MRIAVPPGRRTRTGGIKARWVPGRLKPDVDPHARLWRDRAVRWRTSLGSMDRTFSVASTQGETAASWSSLTSAATTVVAPKARATWHTVKPMLPIPLTATRVPVETPARATAWTAAGSTELSMTASSMRMSLGSLKMLASGTITYSANPPSRSIPRWRIHGQMLSSPRIHHSHTPHPTTASTTTRVPGDGLAGDAAFTTSPTIS